MNGEEAERIVTLWVKRQTSSFKINEFAGMKYPGKIIIIVTSLYDRGKELGHPEDHFEMDYIKLFNHHDKEQELMYYMGIIIISKK